VSVGLSTLAMVAIVIIIVASVGFALYLPTTSHCGSACTTSSVIYQTVESNMTLRGQAAAVPCVGFNEANCPSASNSTLRDVDLILYGNTYYYLYNFTETPTGYSTFSNATTTITSYPKPSTFTTWFTNSSVFCISPAHPLTNTERQNPTCPTAPYSSMTIAIRNPSSTSALNSSSGLRLDLALALNASGGVAVVASVLNTRSSTNTVAAENQWPLGAEDMLMWVQGYCGPPPDLPLGYAIFQGNYSPGNLTGATPLALEAQPLGGLCPAQPVASSFAFNPASDVASVSESGGIGGGGGENVTTSTACQRAPGIDCWWGGLGTWSGYWTGSTQQNGAGLVSGGACPGQTASQQFPSGCPLEFNRFAPGVYTVVAGDEWGQVAILHFTVASS